MPGDRLALGDKSWVEILFVFPALDVDVGLQVFEQSDGSRVVIQMYSIDAFQCSEAGSAEIIRNQRAIKTFVHLGIGRNGDDQQITKTPRVLKVMNMAGMNDVEAAMTVDHALSCGARFRPPGEQPIARADFRIDSHDLKSLSVESVAADEWPFPLTPRTGMFTAHGIQLAQP